MASIIINRSRTTVNETTAIITITPSGFSLPGGPNDRPTAYSNMQYQYKTNNTNWQNSNKITISKIGSNCEQYVEVQCRISYTISNYTWIPPVKDPETGITITSGYWQLQSTSTGYSNPPIEEKIPIYFHPGSFSMEATSDIDSSNNIIANVLTKEKIDRWIEHFQKAYHWHNQNNNNYNIDLSVIENKPIEAAWFNKCMIAMNTFDNKNYKTDYQGGPNGDLITAAAINQMNFSGTK